MATGASISIGTSTCRASANDRLPPAVRSLQDWLEAAFESFLFNSRLIVLLAVIGSLTSAVLMFVRGAVVIVRTAKEFFHHFFDPHAGETLTVHLISSVDSFLFATVLLIFAMGIYELFISKIDPASRTAQSRPNWLQIHSLDDLKGAIGKVILMILIVQLFESAVKLRYERPLDLLYLGVAVLLVAAALYLQHLAHAHPAKEEEYHSERHPAPPRAQPMPPTPTPPYARPPMPIPPSQGTAPMPYGPPHHPPGRPYP
jgi:uncharacterized membrane protein YqhA